MSIMNTVAVVGADAPPKAIQVGGLDSSGNIAPFSIDADGKLEIAGAFSADPPVGASTEAKQDTLIGHVDGIETLLGTIDADTSALAAAVDGTEMQVDVVSSALPTGASTEAKQDTIIGHIDGLETLLTSLVALFAPAVAASATLSNVSSSASNVTLLAANTDRIGVLVVNDSTATLYLKYGATATSSSYTVKMEPGSYWEMPQPIYTGIIDGIWSSANGAARITELT
jgi:hypothetical protein